MQRGLLGGDWPAWDAALTLSPLRPTPLLALSPRTALRAPLLLQAQLLKIEPLKRQVGVGEGFQARGGV